MSIQSKIDQRITKLQRVRELLADPETLALLVCWTPDSCTESWPTASAVTGRYFRSNLQGVLNGIRAAVHE